MRRGCKSVAVSDENSRVRSAALAGHTGNEAEARARLADPSARVRSAALGALDRISAATDSDITSALADPDPIVRHRACEVAIGYREVNLAQLLNDPDPGVAEVAAWALGEREEATEPVVMALCDMATGHDDPLCREAAVAALGAIGDERSLPAILAATTDKPAIRRRAVIALAPFDGPEVEAALTRALEDRDWQVRQAAEELSPGS